MNEAGGYYYLKRFHVDPAKVRVSLRRTDGGYTARVAPRSASPGCYASAVAMSPAKAIEDALLLANGYRFPGMNPGLCNAYEHPWGEVAYRTQGPNPRERTTRHKNDVEVSADDA